VLEGGALHFKNAVWEATVANGELKGAGTDGQKRTLKRVERKSPTLGATPPSGATVLFDGKTADAWKFS
jgi:hypothetical protein